MRGLFNIDMSEYHNNDFYLYFLQSFNDHYEYMLCVNNKLAKHLTKDKAHR